MLTKQGPFPFNREEQNTRQEKKKEERGAREEANGGGVTTVGKQCDSSVKTVCNRRDAGVWARAREVVARRQADSRQTRQRQARKI
jgi:hypothetical protein